jgi:hypothetical protein
MLEAPAGRLARDSVGQATAKGKGCMNKFGESGKGIPHCSMRLRRYVAECIDLKQWFCCAANRAPVPTSLGTSNAFAALPPRYFALGDSVMRRTFTMLCTLGALAGLAACGHTTEQKTASAAVAGAVVGGPVGAAVGGAAGNVFGHATDGKR